MSLLGPNPFSPYGVAPSFVQIVAPSLYSRNEEDDLDVGTGCRVTGFPQDSLYPSDPRSDCLALTPVYRNGQKRWFELIDKYPNHGPYSMSGPDANNGTNLDPDNPVWHEWDGVTIFPAYSPDTLTVSEKEQYRSDWYRWLFPGYPNDYIIRGLKQLYDQYQPFADELEPTPSEIEKWNDQVLNHFRRLSGLPPAVMSQELFIMCTWSLERKTTTIWDTDYPGTNDSAYGPCQGGTNLHCGTTFKPNYEDQKPYWNYYNCNYPCAPDPQEITLNQGTEAILVWYNGNAMTAMSRNLRKLFEGCANGAVISGHAGPYAGRPLYGLAVGRSKWAGSNPYPVPPVGYSF